VYKGTPVSDHRVDLIVEGTVVVELKSVAGFDPVFMAQVMTYLRCTGLRVGSWINFNGRVLRTGVKRFVL
jgi:GxxExxY protein